LAVALGRPARLVDFLLHLPLEVLGHHFGFLHGVRFLDALGAHPVQLVHLVLERLLQTRPLVPQGGQVLRQSRLLGRQRLEQLLLLVALVAETDVLLLAQSHVLPVVGDFDQHGRLLLLPGQLLDLLQVVLQLLQLSAQRLFLRAHVLELVIQLLALLPQKAHFLQLLLPLFHLQEFKEVLDIFKEI